MGNCIFCGEPAGFLKKAHNECKKKYEEGESEIISLVSYFGLKGGDLHDLEMKIEQVAKKSYINKVDKEMFILAGWEKAVYAALKDGVLTEEEDKALIELKDYFTFLNNDIDRNRAFKKIIQKRHDQAKLKIISLVSKVGSTGGDLRKLESELEQVKQRSQIDNNELKKLVITGWEKAVDRVFEDAVLSEEEEKALVELQEYFTLTQNDLDRNGAFMKVVKGAVLREVLNGNLPEKLKISGKLPFNFQKSEKIIWVFKDVDYFEEKTRTQYVGGHQGISIRIAKGLYYRTGAFKGERVQTSETLHLDTGLLGVTNKHIYYAGSSKRFRIAYKKIVAFEPYSDGIGVQRDAATAKPQTFVTGDGWFTYNLIVNLSQI